MGMFSSKPKEPNLPKRLDYIIVEGKSKDIVAKVDQRITEGFDPIGGITVTEGMVVTFYQAMIRHNKLPE